MAQIRIIWDKAAKESLRNHIHLIKEDSIQSAENILSDILKTIGKLEDYPEMYPLDRLKLNNVGDTRAFEKHNLRVAYTYSDNQIRILRIRHVKQEPKTY